MNVSVIIPTYNRKELLRGCLESIFNQNYSKDQYEIIVADDGSTDGTGEMVKRLKFNNLRYFYQKNQGQATAMNLGVKNAKGEIIAFTDDDCVVSKNWLVELLKGFKDNHKIAGAGGEIKVLNPKTLSEKWADVSFFHPDELIEGRDLPPFISGCNCAYKTEILKKVGLFDSSLTFQEQDLDFGWRLYFLGYRFLYLPKAIIFNRVPKTLWQLLKKNFNYGRGKARIIAKYQNRLKKSNYRYSVNIFRFIGKDLIKLPSWPKKLATSYRHSLIKYKKNQSICWLKPFLDILIYLTYISGIIYQKFKLRIGE